MPSSFSVIACFIAKWGFGVSNAITIAIIAIFQVLWKKFVLSPKERKALADAESEYIDSPFWDDTVKKSVRLIKESLLDEEQTGREETKLSEKPSDILDMKDTQEVDIENEDADILEIVKNKLGQCIVYQYQQKNFSLEIFREIAKVRKMAIDKEITKEEYSKRRSEIEWRRKNGIYKPMPEDYTYVPKMQYREEILKIN